jgi:hypothetical protein
VLGLAAPDVDLEEAGVAVAPLAVLLDPLGDRDAQVGDGDAGVGEAQLRVVDQVEEIAAAVLWLCSPTTQTPPSGCCGSRSVPSRSSPSMSATSGTVTPEAASHARRPSSASQPYEPHSGW